jgi:hypothetical protein
MKTLRIISSTVLLILSVVLLFLVPVQSVAIEQKGPISKKELKVLLAAAKTAAEHRRIANFYQQEARRLTDRSKYDEEMGAIYRSSPLPYEGKFPHGTVGLSHCRYWTQLYAAQAKEADSLAALHEEMARAAEQKQQ